LRLILSVAVLRLKQGLTSLSVNWLMVQVLWISTWVVLCGHWLGVQWVVLTKLDSTCLFTHIVMRRTIMCLSSRRMTRLSYKSMIVAFSAPSMNLVPRNIYIH